MIHPFFTFMIPVMIQFQYIPYSGKLWRALNLANQPSECTGEFLIWRSRALSHRAIMCEIILVGFKFGDCLQNRQFAKLKTSPKFPAIRYSLIITITITIDMMIMDNEIFTPRYNISCKILVQI